MRWTVLFVTCLLIGSYATPAYGQSDFELWTEAGVRYKIFEELRVGLDQHLRLEDEASEVESLMTDAKLQWRPMKWLRFGLGYRFIAEPQFSLSDTYWDIWHRPHVDGTLRFKDGDTGLGASFRLRFTERFGWPWDEDGEAEFRHTFRERLRLFWEVVDDVTIHASGELFERVDDPDGILHKVRTMVGVDWEIDDHELSLELGLEQRLDDDDEPTTFILGLGYHFGF